MLVSILTAARAVNLDPKLVARRARLLHILFTEEGGRFVDEADYPQLRAYVEGDDSGSGELSYEQAMKEREALWRRNLPHVGEVVAKITGVSLEEMQRNRRPELSKYEAHLALVWLLHQEDLNVAAMGRLLHRDHSSIVHALARLGFGRSKTNPNLTKVPVARARARETALLVRTALSAEQAGHTSERVQVSYGVLDRTLCTMEPAISIFVNWTLLSRPVFGYKGQEPVLGNRCILSANMATLSLRGVFQLAQIPTVRKAVETALEEAGLLAHVGRIRYHADRLGYAWNW